jgi:hypothetical protein
MTPILRGTKILENDAYDDVGATNLIREELKQGLQHLLEGVGEASWLEDEALLVIPTDPTLPIEVNLPPLGAGPIDLTKLLALLGREYFKLPEGLPLVSGIYLTRLTMILGESLGGSQLFLGLSWPTARWELLKTPLLSLHAPSLALGFRGREFDGLLSGSVDIGDIELQFSVEFPDIIASGYLAPDSSDIHTIKPLLAHFGVPDSIFDKLTLSDASFLVDRENDHLEMQCELADVLEVDIGRLGTFAIETLTFDLARDGGEHGSTAWSVDGKAVWAFVYGDQPEERVDLYLSVKYTHVSTSADDGNGSTAGDSGEKKSGWQFEGASKPGQIIPIGKLVKHLADKFGLPDKDVPDVVESLSFVNLAVSFDTITDCFAFSGGMELELGGAKVDATISVTVEPDTDAAAGDEEVTSSAAKTSYRKVFGGHMSIGHRQFDLCFEKAKAGNCFVASYAGEGDTLHLMEDLISPIVGPAAVPELSVTLQDALFAYTSADGTSKKIFAVALQADLPVPKLPLIGEVLFSVDDLQMLYATDVIKGNAIKSLNAALPDGVTKLPAPHASADGGVSADPGAVEEPIALNKGFNVVANLTLAGETLKLSTVGKRSAVRQDSQSSPETQGKGAQDKGATQAAPSPQTARLADGSEVGGKGVETTDVTGHSKPSDLAPNGNAQWISIQKAVGPLYFDKVGVSYDEGELWLLLNANLDIGGLTLLLDGLALSSPLDKFSPTFHLQGLGLDYKKPPVEIGGMFARSEVGVHEEYTGSVVVKTETMCLSAMGAYAEMDGHPSMFIYMTLDEPLGGPPFFFVTGLAGGVGFNRGLKIPPIEKLAAFPFIAQANSPAPEPDEPVSIGTQLEKLKDYVPAETGAFWLAAGVHFTSFEIVDAFALLTVAFGHQPEVHVLGKATYAYPPGSGEAGKALTRVDVVVKASYLPEEGTLEVKALIADGSYLYTPDCHLTGGLAFKTWFKGPHQDEFIFTLGGYHPKFKVPDYYPQVPRLAFNWHYSDELTVKGGMYFAMTGHVLMAGGNLDATWDSGALSAWLKINADFLVRYKPFHYNAEMSIDVGAQVTIHFFGTHHLSVHLGADLSIWGPDFAGTASFDIWIASFSISFGDGAETPASIDWTTFKDAFLPADEAIVGISVGSGMVKSLKGFHMDESYNVVLSNDKDSMHWLINPRHFGLITHSVIPANIGSVVGQVGVAPMNLRNDVFTASHDIVIKRNGKRCTFRPDGLTNEEAAEHDYDFMLIPVRRPSPAGLWGNAFTVDVNECSVVDDALTGYQVVPAKHPDGGNTAAIERDKLAFDTETMEGAYDWVKEDAALEEKWLTVGTRWDEEFGSGELAQSVTKLGARKQLLRYFFDEGEVEQMMGVASASELLVKPADSVLTQGTK